MRFGFEISADIKSKSPEPSNFSAPEVSIIVLESIWLATCRATLLVIFAFMSPVIISTEGRCVERTR